MKLEIDGGMIGEGEKTFIIAEVGLNHDGDIKTAKKLIIAAKHAGADAVKFQTYKTDKRVPIDSPIYNILKKCELTEEETRELQQYANSKSIIFFSTPFDEDSLNLLVDMKVPLIKIASFDIVNKKLLRKVAKTKIPLIMSRGMANEKEVQEAVDILDEDNAEYAILHCTSAYPTRGIDANLSVIRTLMKKYDCPVGYSDHTLGLNAPILSVAAGACIIEKHFTLDKTKKTADQSVSCEPNELEEMIQRIRKIEKVMGNPYIEMHESEKDTLQYRRPT